MTTGLTGEIGEDLATHFLSDKGFKIVMRNYRVKNFGEIDIIAIDGDILVFVEVKTRQANQQTYLHESITPSQIASIKRVGHLFVEEFGEGLPEALRVDAVLISYEELLDEPVVYHFNNIEG